MERGGDLIANPTETDDLPKLSHWGQFWMVCMTKSVHPLHALLYTIRYPTDPDFPPTLKGTIACCCRLQLLAFLPSLPSALTHSHVTDCQMCQ
jgi:hypothetical protein